jgi:hypothetical protein
MATVRVVLERADYAFIEWDPDERAWWVGVYNGRRKPTGERCITAYRADRLGLAVEAVRAAPLSKTAPPPSAQGTLLT